MNQWCPRSMMPYGITRPQLAEYKLTEARWCIYMPLNLVITGSGNGLLPVKHHAITWTNEDLFWIWPWGTKFCEIWNDLKHFHWWNCICKCYLPKWRPSCISLNVLKSCSFALFVKYCLVAWRHLYLNQCRLLVREILWYSPESNFTCSRYLSLI